MFVHTLAKFDDARRGSACGCQIVDLRAYSKVILVTYIVVNGIDLNSSTTILCNFTLCGSFNSLTFKSKVLVSY